MSPQRKGRPRRSIRGRHLKVAHYVYLGTLCFPLLTAMLLVWLIELDHPSAGAPIQVVVTGDPASPATDLYTEIERFSTEHRISVALSTTELQDPSTRVLYVWPA